MLLLLNCVEQVGDEISVLTFGLILQIGVLVEENICDDEDVGKAEELPAPVCDAYVQCSFDFISFDNLCKIPDLFISRVDRDILTIEERLLDSIEAPGEGSNFTGRQT